MASLHYAYGCMVVLDKNTGVTMLVSYDIPNEGAKGNIIHTHTLVPSYSSFYLLACGLEISYTVQQSFATRR